MRKILLFLTLFYGHLYALERESTLKMYHGIFSALSSKTKITVYTTDKEYEKVFATSKRLLLSKKPEESDIILTTNTSTLESILNRNLTNINSKKPILFVTDYRLLKNSEEVVGAFYWRKGRSQLLFIKSRLQEHNITLPAAYQNFMIDEL